MKKNLAIVIPAYKSEYLRETLDSIAKQTCQDFKVYIGDDCSPNFLYDIVSEFKDKIDLFYIKFDVNFGGADLVRQWERCIDLIGDEEWIWLFSDDDVMEPRCVEMFYKSIAESDAELLHFDVKVVDGSTKILESTEAFPKILKVEDFFQLRINYELHSYVVEYVFTKSLYQRKNKFQNFDLAWCADDATWIKFGEENGIFTIDAAYVLWRFSDSNVSSVVSNVDIVIRKVKSAISYVNWVEHFLKTKLEFKQISKVKKMRWILGSVDFGRSLDFLTRIKLYIMVLSRNGYKSILDLKSILWMGYSLLKNGFQGQKKN